jgi:hypothetical protein
MIKQYVNLPPRASDHHGASVRLEVQASSLGSDTLAQTEWWVEPVGTSNTDSKYLSRSERARMRHPIVRNRNNVFQNTLILSHVGGDKYKPRCAKKGDRSTAVELEEFETWRKIYYTVHWMNAQCLATFNAVKSRFQDVFKAAFIELEQVDSPQTLKDEPHTRSSNALTHLYQRNPALKDKPFHLRLVVLNDIFDPDTGEYRDTLTGLTQTVMTDLYLSDTTPTHFCRYARARIDGGAAFSIRSLVTKTGDRELTINASAHTRISNALAAGKNVTFVIGTRELGSYEGHSIGNFCCVRAANPDKTASEIETTVLQTITHEVGHGFQQVVKRERLHDAAGNPKGWENNPKWHRNPFGGDGPHCSTNATLIRDISPRRFRTRSGKIYAYGGSGVLCTMFFSDEKHVDPNGKFCPSCLPRLTRVNLSARRMRQESWDAY